MSERTKILVAIAAASAGVTFNQIMSACRRRPLPLCRYMVARELIFKDSLSTTAAASELGIDHSTVIHGLHQLHLVNMPGYEQEHEIVSTFQMVCSELN